MTPLIYPSGDLFITTNFIIAKNENVLDSKMKKMKNSYLPNPVMTSACIINRSNETIFQLICSVLVRNSYHPQPIIPAVQPPVLDPSPKSVEDCGWTTMDYLGLAFILCCCCAVIGGIFACICCCSKGGRSSNF